VFGDAVRAVTPDAAIVPFDRLDLNRADVTAQASATQPSA